VADSVHANLERIRRENLFGKASRSRVEDVLAIFPQRYLGESCVTKALVVLVKKRLAAAALDRILYFHAARADRLLHDTVTEILIPLQARGITEIDALEIQRPLKKWVDAGKSSGEWSEPTILRIARGLLSTLRDFGVLQARSRSESPRPTCPLRRSPILSSTSSSTSLRGPSWLNSPTGNCSSFRAKASSGSCSRPTSTPCWSTTRQAA
jgi:BrxA